MLHFFEVEKKLFQTISLAFLATLILYFIPNRVNAQKLVFHDNFDDERETWSSVYENWSIIGDDNKFLATGFTPQDTLALTIPAQNPITSEDYSVSAKMFSVSGVDQMLWFGTNDTFDSYYAVNLRASGWIDSNNIRIKKVVNEDRTWMYQINPTNIGCSIVHGQWYGVRVEVEKGTITVGIKCPLATDYNNIFSIDEGSSILSGTIGLVAWSGSWDRGVEKHFDEVSIRLLDPLQPPLVILPGLGASWNTDALVYGKAVGLNDWSETPFVNVYDNLLKTATDGGLVLGEDLFFWNYDWRKPIAQTADDFNQFVTNTPQLASASKINLVGHSLGGLVAKAWGQEFGSGKIENLITVGSPYRGAVKAYRALAGGQLGENLDLGWLAAQLLFQIHRNGFKTNAQMARQMLPVLSDIAPTFDFLRKQGRIVSSSFPNNWLATNQQDQTLLPITTFFVGNTGQTVDEWLNLTNRSYLDQLLDLWPDGIIKSSIKGDGDGTVLKKSAYLTDSLNSDWEFNLNHQQIISTQPSVEKIFQVLGRDLSFVKANDIFPVDNLLIFFLASPATLMVEGQVPEDPQKQFVIIPNPEIKNYRAQVTGVASGNYHLYLGQITPSGSFWSQYQGATQLGQVDQYDFAINFGSPQSDPLVDPTGLQQLAQAKKLLLELLSQDNSRSLVEASTGIDLAVTAIGQSKFTQAIIEIKKSLNYLSAYREKLNQSQIDRYYQAELVMEKMATAWKMILTSQRLASKSSADTNYRAAQSYRSLADKLLRLAQRKNSIISPVKALSLKKAEELLPVLADYWRQADYSSLESQAYLVRLFAKEGFVQ